MRRGLSFESLENRMLLAATDYLSYYIDQSELAIEPTYTTVDSPNNHVTGTSNAALTGAVRLNISTNIGNGIGSGVLLPDGRHILTAAHNVTGEGMQQFTATSMVVTFELPTGNVTRNVVLNTIAVHPNWNPNDISAGNDLAILELDDLAPAAARRIDIYRGSSEFGQIGAKAGYGQSGQGVAQPTTFPSGIKRDGENRWELYLDDTTIANSVLLYDFDSGNFGNNSFALVGATSDLGQGNEEIMTAPGDSGGPTIFNGSIAGITSFRGTLGVGDSAPGTNSSFGEVGGDTRISTFAPWIDSIVGEPGAPQVWDVSIGGSGWTIDPYSYASIVPTGEQLAPIYTGGVDTIALAFTEDVVVDQNALTLWGTGTTAISHTGFSYDATTHIATWSFATLGFDKYRLDLAATDVEDLDGNLLDGEWDNLFNGTRDIFSDDPTGRMLLSGNGVAGGAFQFLFSVLPGDYNQDGIVIAAGAGNDTSVAKDGNGDGVIDSADTNLVTTNNGLRLPLRFANGGDYYDDERVDAADYAFWRSTFGSSVTPGTGADGNSDGIVDAADYTIWRDRLGAQSAWYTGPSGIGALMPVVDFGDAPTVMNVTISGLNSTHDPYSFDSYVGSGEQLRTVPVGGADTISITFSEDVNIAVDNLKLVSSNAANVPTIAEFAYDMLSMTATWRFDDLVANGQYTISLSDAVTDIEGNRLDGEWTNPASLTTVNALVSEFPSGDGSAGGNFNFVFTLLSGDANRDGIYDNADVLIISANFGAPSGKLFTQGDFSGEGAVSITDYLLAGNNWEIDYSSVLLLADLNGDFSVDHLDADILGDNWGMSSPTHGDGDVNGDGAIDVDDLDLMFAQYGLELSMVA